MCLFGSKKMTEYRIKQLEEKVEFFSNKCPCFEKKIDELDHQIRYELNHVADELSRLSKFHENEHKPD